MDIIYTAVAVMLGNILTVIFLWGCYQLYRNEEKAGYLVYSAIAWPAFFAAGALYLTGPSQPESGAAYLQAAPAPAQVQPAVLPARQ